MAEKIIRILFVPGNPSHVKSQLPVAEELRERGHRPSFLIRDRVVPRDYRTAAWIEAERFEIHEYSDFYESDIDRRLPNPAAYVRSKRAIFAFLSSLEFDVSVVCNDTSALFERLVVEFCRRHRRHSLLIQESVRPAKRRMPLKTQLEQQGVSFVTTKMINALGRYLMPWELARKPYGHSPCTMIAAAGDRFRRELIREGVPGSKIRVAGQPRLDIAPSPHVRHEQNAERGAIRVLLFCSQPLPGPREITDQLFRQLVSACDSCENVRLLVKLHPRDMPPESWLELLTPGTGVNLIDVTQTRPLEECFKDADAMATIASTTCLEAMATGLPVGLINYLPTQWYLPYDEHGAVLSIDSRETLPQSIQRLLFDEGLRTSLIENAPTVLHDELYLQDGCSARRIADFVEDRFYARTGSPVYQ